MMRLMIAAFVAVCLVGGNADASDREKQVGEKEFKVAEYYRKTGHPGSAAFYYQIVARRYPGTSIAELAKEHLLELKK